MCVEPIPNVNVYILDHVVKDQINDINISFGVVDDILCEPYQYIR